MARCPIKHAASSKEYYKNNKVKVNLKNENNRLLREYGITLERRNAMLEHQNHCCAICNRHQNTLKNKLNVDHNHTTGQVRDLLCNPCNQALGYAQESPEILNKMIKYLARHGN